jgi:hypothetical protein
MRKIENAAILLRVLKRVHMLVASKIIKKARKGKGRENVDEIVVKVVANLEEFKEKENW